MASYSRDPRWTKSKFTSTCSKCGRRIEKGEDIFFFPTDKTVLCNDEDCGKVSSRIFESQKQDEENNLCL